MYTDVQPRRRFTLSCQKFASTLVPILLINAFIACSGSPQRTIVQPTITASISPTTVALGPGGVQSFTAAVQNTSDTDVTWYVNQVNGGSSSTGTITSTGVYTAPTVTSQTVFTVTAVANANTSITASAAVTVTPAVSVTLNVHTASVKTGQSQQFIATVINTPNTAVTWQVNGIVGGNTMLGTITTGGLYTAPNSVPTPATVTVTAVSVADPTKMDFVTVTITLTVVINVSVNPPNPIIALGKSQLFNAVVTGTPDTAVTWSISGTGSECTGGGTPCGAIDPLSGLYMAPATVPTPATVTVIATSQADGTTTGTTTVTVVATVGVTISPPGSVSVALGGTLMFMATVTGDTQNLGVKWTETCTADDEGSPFEDCTGDNDADGDENKFVDQPAPSFSTTLTAVTTLISPFTSYTITVSATTVATDIHGNTQTSATTTITIP
jgi:hypothetical protein